MRVRGVFGLDFAAVLHTGVWSAHHLNPLWLRSPGCGSMAVAARTGGACTCGTVLTDRPAYL
jgi:hypothetical protein